MLPLRLAAVSAADSPTSVAASAVAVVQPPFSLVPLNTLANAFRQAVHIRKRPGPEWTHSILNGLEGAHPVLRLAASTGLVLGLADKSVTIPTRVQDHAIIALAQVMAMYTSVEWDHNSNDTLALSLILAAQSLPLISSERLQALPLPTLVNLLTVSLVFAFTQNDFSSVSSLSRLAGLSLSLLLDTHPEQGLASAQECLISLRDLAARPDPPKPLLFSTVMISDSVLSSAVYIPPSRYTEITPLDLAHTTLHTLSHMSNLIADFGGIHDAFKELRKTTYLALDILASASASSETAVAATNAFINELVQAQSPLDLDKKAFALVCIEQLVPASSVGTIVDKVWNLVEPHLSSPTTSNRQVYESAHSVVLAIFARAQSESASIPATQHPESDSRIDKGKGRSKGDDFPTLTLISFTRTLLPSYTQTLIQNSSPNDRLTTTQLCMAFEATARCAVACDKPAATTSSSISFSMDNGEDSLAEMIIEDIITAARTLENSSHNDSDSREQLHRLRLSLVSCLSALPVHLLERALEECKRVLMLPHFGGSGGDADDEDREGDGERREALIQALYKEILEKVGDREKDVVVKWWYDILGDFAAATAAVGDDHESRMGRERRWGDWFRARL
ncbi:hypothetical protein K435DRAFT_835673 [Dendrothele bispora CBS 962.96]|uniref:Uncharacterized protein n=1 Tax=Dendrothele bispora (strain CBS 962.96) TaxID=1314807 RepID=A0A4S8MLW8_DENBC|nr:hypothetical protein K435DRAFT_835673 [Dendrothele bispora CBS 962.96]